MMLLLLLFRQLKTIEEVQDALDSYGSINGTLEHLSRPDDEVIRELLAFLSALLFNGNENVQVIVNLVLLFCLRFSHYV